PGTRISSTHVVGVFPTPDALLRLARAVLGPVWSRDQYGLIRTRASRRACNRQRNVTRVASCLPWAKPARAAGMRVAGSIWFVPMAARESASGVAAHDEWQVGEAATCP